MQDKIPHLGKIVDGGVHYTKLGGIVKQQWLWLKHYSYVALDEFIVMSNHFHGILIIDPLLILENNVGATVGCSRMDGRLASRPYGQELCASE